MVNTLIVRATSDEHIWWDRWPRSREHTEGNPSDITSLYFRTRWKKNKNWRWGFLLNTFSPKDVERTHMTICVTRVGLPCLCNTSAVYHAHYNSTGVHKQACRLFWDSVHISWPEGISLMLSVQGSSEPTWHTAKQEIFLIVDTNAHTLIQWRREIWPCVNGCEQKHMRFN